MNALRFILCSGLLLFGSSVSHAAFTFLGPTPYRSAADSPFNLSGLGTTFFLEDFEDLVPQPGLDIGPDPILEIVRQIGSSVDADDGVIDDSRFTGFSAGPNMVIDAALTTEIIQFKFDVGMLGFVPTAVGLVITSGAGPDSGVTVVDNDGNRATFSTNSLVINSFSSADDRFIGILNPAGIVQVEFFARGFSAPGVLVDHVQYGRTMPEPSTFLITLLAVSCYPGRGYCWA